MSTLFTNTLKSILYQIPVTPYAQTNRNGDLIGDGVSESLVWNGSDILLPTKPPTSHCCGFVFEFLFRVLQHYGKEKSIKTRDMNALVKWVFVHEPWLEQQGYDITDDSPDGAIWGGPRALINWGWADLVEDPRDCEMGDVVQKWDFIGGEKRYGHTMIARGITGEKDGYDTLLNRGSQVKQGVIDDWHYIDGTPIKRERRFLIARLKESWLSE